MTFFFKLKKQTVTGKFRLGPACLENYVTHEVATSPAAAVGITMVCKWIMFVVESDSGGNFVEIYSHSNWFLRRFIFGPIIRKKSEILPLTEVNFDGFSLPAPREWKNILQSLYGDFMITPPNEELGHIITDTFHSCKKIDN